LPLFPQYNRPFGHLHTTSTTKVDSAEIREVFPEHTLDNDSRDSQKDSNQVE
jgi:hypothetical protein